MQDFATCSSFAATFEDAHREYTALCTFPNTPPGAR